MLGFLLNLMLACAAAFMLGSGNVNPGLLIVCGIINLVAAFYYLVRCIANQPNREDSSHAHSQS